MSARAELKGKSSMDASGWDSAMTRMKQSGGSFVSGISAKFLGVTAIVAGVIAAVRGVLDTMEESAKLERFARGIGISADRLRGLAAAASYSGAEGDGFIAKIAKMTQVQEDAINGTKMSADSFQRLGISMKELQTLSPEQLLVRVAQGARSSATGVADLNAVMGRGAATEYKTVLDEIATNGLSGIDNQLQRNIVAMSALNRKWQQLKDTVGDTIKTIQTKALQSVGLLPSDKELDSQIAQQDKAREEDQRKKVEGLKELARIKRAEAESKIREPAEKKQEESQKKFTEAISKITISAPKAADSLASIGGIVGAQTSPLAGAMERIEKVSEAQKNLQEDSKKILEEMNDKLKALED